MILGMTTANFTLFHVILSLIGIATGVIVLFGMLASRRFPGLTAIFLITTLATTVTGFFFPIVGLDPARIVGIISLVLLAAALAGIYVGHLVGSWRWIYVVGAMMALYLNVFVGVVQSFQKLSFLHPLAPTGSEHPFKEVQAAVLILFIVLGALALRRFHPRPAGMT
jgi:hypothetical protein